MLRDDLEVALNDLNIALREASDAYDTSAQILGPDEWVSFFTQGRDLYGKLAERLDDEQRRLGYLPKEPDSEIILLHEAAAHAKASLAADERTELLTERSEQEARIMECAEAVLDLELGDSLRRLVEQIKQQSTANAARLEALGLAKRDT